CNGVSRIDFLMDTKTGEFWLNEINTIPGSLSFYLWEPTGMKYTELLDKLVSLALKRHRTNERINYSYDTNILSQCGSFGSKGSKM
ncbi:MAG: D-alanine--D-alanine ligase, partial [Oscillospiraceae bacterium]|nr:D-alanine--D-alanine ligase [Oscillospiraceae bacterium]